MLLFYSILYLAKSLLHYKCKVTRHPQQSQRGEEQCNAVALSYYVFIFNNMFQFVFNLNSLISFRTSFDLIIVTTAEFLCTLFLVNRKLFEGLVDQDQLPAINNLQPTSNLFSHYIHWTVVVGMQGVPKFPRKQVGIHSTLQGYFGASYIGNI